MFPKDELMFPKDELMCNLTSLLLLKKDLVSERAHKDDC